MSQTIKALIILREKILNGEFPPGERLLELKLVEQLSVSRTPVRSALATLAHEGLLTRTDGGGYTVREFSERDIRDAIESRGCLEGLAARLAAERGTSTQSLQVLHECLAEVDALLQESDLDDDAFERYFELNAIFHDQLVGLAESFVIGHLLQRIIALPFASPNAFVMAESELGQAWKVFFVAQNHHRSIVEAIENREGARAESLAREHARLALRTLRTALKSTAPLEQIPGIRLVSSST